jgi:pimeloyl-ACP methyl ester carboxylesterase/DNA-binding CsgD family transcriptional regulator
VFVPFYALVLLRGQGGLLSEPGPDRRRKRVRLAKLGSGTLSSPPEWLYTRCTLCAEVHVDPPIQYAHSADGASIAYAAFGAGPPLLGVPSLGVTMGFTGMQVAPFLSDFRRGFYDRRGTGGSSRGMLVTKDNLVSDCLAVVDSLAFDSFHIMSNRFGQFEAVQLALRWPLRVRGLVLNSPFADGWADEPRPRAWRAALEMDWEWFAEAFIRSWGATPGQTVSRDWVDHFKETNDPEGFGAVFRTLAQWDLSEDLKRLEIPTLVIHKAASSFQHPVDVAASFARSIPGATLVIDEDPDLVPLSTATQEALRHFFMSTMPADEIPASWRAPQLQLGQASTFSRLSDREREVLKLVAEGRSNRDIAELLVLAPPTIASHVRHILDKLGVETRAAAAAWAGREGLAR